ncbi:hypothetical protein [Kitasatospora indigofera]|uniref:hypothetical protein n=1 Tax=Kitasatospora indigofera TaxID=67307 RepID=UPI00367AB0BF
MPRTKLRGLRLTAFFFLLIGLVALSQPARAASSTVPSYFAMSADRTSAHPGESVTVTMTFTNNQTTDVQFVFQSFQQTYETMTAVSAGLTYSWTGCTDDQGNACTPGVAPGFTALIHPGEARTATLTYRIGADSNCGGPIKLGFYSYVYYEWAGGAGTEDGLSYTGDTFVNCTT